ncbi:UDP-glycosyltransferase UGT5-like [Condylostylus longicornis]|uniref:UDP-glycosyltransferase UGT5-like n=1 Tax=Condylostylus longicornis TaxID=2530218 RepID=UPI00244DCA3A|nr:UDP-glycosyltransferase UGT5-like [Condylostylus longicornis]
MKLIFGILILKSILAISYGHKILGLFPTVAKSHHIVGTALMEKLAERGHEITMVSPFKADSKLSTLKNFRDVVIEETYNQSRPMIESIFEMVTTKNIFEIFHGFSDIGIKISNLTMQEPMIQKLLKSNEKFDLIICEMTMNEVLLGFGHRFNAPIIAVSTFGPSLWTTDLVGTPSPLSYVPHPFLKLSDKMNLIERIMNILAATYERIYYDNFYYPRQVNLYNEHFPNPKPSLQSLRENVSLVLVNSHFSLTAPRPLVPNMIEVGGFHLNRTENPIPNNIKTFLDTAKHGAILFTLGSEIKTTELPPEKLSAILNVFRSLKQKVLFKWENWNLPNKPDNVLISNWFPQKEILSHSNLKLLITQGGLLSIMEAINAGVPFIGIPLYGDQYMNMKFAEKSGIGISLSYDMLDEKELRTAVAYILEDQDYEHNIKELKSRYEDQPIKPIDNAIYWIEYVIKHKGAIHMRSAGQHLNYIQYHNIDALGILFGIAFIIFYLIWALIMKCLCSGRSKRQKFQETNQPNHKIKYSKKKKNN